MVMSRRTTKGLHQPRGCLLRYVFHFGVMIAPMGWRVVVGCPLVYAAERGVCDTTKSAFHQAILVVLQLASAAVDAICTANFAG